MAIALNAGYNSPELAAVAQNIAQMFGPPSASELAGYSTAALNRQKHEQIAQLFGEGQTPSERAALVGIQNYGQTPQGFTYQVDQNNATQRYGFDTQAATSRANTADTNRTSLIGNMFGALNEGQVRPTLPGDIAGMYGLPELPAVAGAPKPLTADQVMGGQTQRLIDSGQINDETIKSMIVGDTPVENIVGPDGKPLTVFRNNAVGAEPYINPGAAAKPTNGVAILKDGTKVPATQGPDGRWRHAQTGEELPADIQVFGVPQAQGTAEEVGMVSKPTGSQIEQQLIDIAVAKQTATTLRDLIAQSPSSQGAVGWLRGTAQNVIQTGGELGKFFGGNVEEITKEIEKGLADADLAGAFDPNIPAIDMLANLLAFQYAKTTTGERLSNEMLNASRRALGLDGLDANQANSLARLNQAIKQIEAQESLLKKARTGGVDALTPDAPAGEEVWDFDQNGNLVRVQ